MNVEYELLQRGCLMARENRLKQERIREASPERKAQHRRYDRSEAGRESMRLRGLRYRATEKGRENSRRKSRKYWLKVKNDPAFKAKKNASLKVWRMMRKVRPMQGEHTLWLMGGCITVNMGMAA